MTAATSTHRSDPRPFAAAVYGDPALTRSDELAALRGELKNELRVLRTAIGRIQSSEAAAEISALRELIEQALPEPPARGAASRRLRQIGVEGPCAARLLRQLRERKDGDPEQQLDDALSDAFGVAPWPIDGEPSLVVLVGPSGVGKTTTCAKLAANAVRDGRTVTLVACDGYRVGGTRQLERYAELLGATIALATNGDELGRAVSAARTDVVIVDTAGTRERHEERTIAQRIGKAAPPGRTRHVLLAMPASIRARDASLVVSGFAPTMPSALCITKLDETAAPAGILHGAAAAGLPVAVLCNGPRVPEDIVTPTRAAIVAMLTRKDAKRTP